MSYLDDSSRHAIVNDILLSTRNGQLDQVRLGTFVELGRKYECHERTTSRIWKRFKASVAAGHVGGDVSSRIKGNSGRRGFDRAEIVARIRAVPIQERGTIAATAKAGGVSTGLLQRLLQENVAKRVTPRIKPALTPANMKARIGHTLAFIDERTCLFEPMYDVVHVDEKWFYEDVDKNTYYTVEDEEPPPRHRRSKRFIKKTMFLAAVARPRYDPHRKTKFNGKIGIWPFTEVTIARRSSVNRPKDTPVTKNIESIDRHVYKDYIINKVIPAIKAVWPRGEKWKVILIQQDNAKPHLSPNDADVVAAGTSDGWNIRMLCQPPNSPDFNVLDLGFFASIQSLQLRKGAHGIKMLVDAVNAAYEEISVETLENVFLSLQSVMLCALVCNGGNEYKLPHSGKARRRREGKLPETLACEVDLYQRAVKEVQWLF